MRFTLTARRTKELWTNGKQWLYLTIERQDERERKWKLFTTQEVPQGQNFTFSGEVSTAINKKIKDANGKDIYVTNYNVDQIAEES